MNYKYIIIYNAESDFIGVYTKGQVKREIAQLLENGEDWSEIYLYSTNRIDFALDKTTRININIED